MSKTNFPINIHWYPCGCFVSEIGPIKGTECLGEIVDTFMLFALPLHCDPRLKKCLRSILDVVDVNRYKCLFQSFSYRPQKGHNNEQELSNKASLIPCILLAQLPPITLRTCGRAFFDFFVFVVGRYGIVCSQPNYSTMRRCLDFTSLLCRLSSGF